MGHVVTLLDVRNIQRSLLNFLSSSLNVFNINELYPIIRYLRLALITTSFMYFLMQFKSLLK
jgi:hypothetical protein